MSPLLSKRNLKRVIRCCFAAAVLLTMHLATNSQPVVEVLDQTNDKVKHFLAFLCLAFLLDLSFPGSQFNGRKIAALLGFGFFIEVVQYFLPHRLFSMKDFAADFAGVFVYLTSWPILRFLRQMVKARLRNGKWPPLSTLKTLGKEKISN